MAINSKWFSLALLVAGLSSVQAQPIDREELERLRNTMPDTSGTGEFPAIKEVDVTLSGQVVYRPADINGLANTKLGIYVFGNGACTDDAASSRQHLLEVASHGYLVIAPGGIYSGPGVVESQIPERAAMNEVPTKPEQLSEAIDWALAENVRKDSRYYGRIDPSAIAVSGYSCGGLQALLNLKDERVATAVLMNTGLFVEGVTSMAGMEVGKERLLDLHSPTLYILGGPTDIAYAAGMDDFARIDHVPVAVANIEKGHGGTYWEPSGGQAAQVTVSWLNWQLRGDKKAQQMFLGENCGLCQDSDWTIETKRLEAK